MELEALVPDYLRDLYKSFGTALDRFHDEPEYRLPMPARYIIAKASCGEWRVEPAAGERIRAY